MAQKTTKMTNVWDRPVKFRIDGTPGSEPVEYEVEPGESVPLPEALCVPVQGAGTNMIPSIMARKTTRTWIDGVRRPALVPASEVEAFKAAVKRQQADRAAEEARARKQPAAAPAAR